MKRVQVQLDEPTYERLRRRAFEQGISMAALVRQVLGVYLKTAPPPRRLEDFKFIGSGYSGQSSIEPISERHDEALSEDLVP